jgi:hypothetical protein
MYAATELCGAISSISAPKTFFDTTHRMHRARFKSKHPNEDRIVQTKNRATNAQRIGYAR